MWVVFLLSKPLYPEEIFSLNARKKNDTNSGLESFRDLAPLSPIVFGWADSSTATARSQNTGAELGGIETLHLDPQLELTSR